MSRTTLTVQQIVTAANGLAVALTTAGTQHSFANDGRVFLYVRNTGAAKTLTMTTPNTVQGLAIADQTATITATTGDQMFGPFPPSLYNNSDGTVYVDLDTVTSASIGVVRL